MYFPFFYALASLVVQAFIESEEFFDTEQVAEKSVNIFQQIEFL